MKFRTIVTSLALALLAATPSWAQDCTLTLVTSVDMLLLDNQPMVPVTINGTSKLLLLDTGGVSSQVTRETVKDLKMVPYEAGARLYDASGQSSSSAVVADSLRLGTLNATHLRLLISPLDLDTADGILSSDLLVRYDVDMDFGTRKLSYFSPDHCPGKVIYWNPPEAAEVPITLHERSRFLVEIKLDGKPFNAVVDTGASRSIISMPVARSLFGLTPDSPGMASAGAVNGDLRLASYYHTFSSLAFEGVTVTKPTLLVLPDRMGGTETETGSRIPTGAPGVKLPELILGMDIMRHLHMYFAFKEKKLYVSAAAAAPPETVIPGQSQKLSTLDKALTLSPTNAGLLNARCYQRGIENIKLGEALADCETALHSLPANAHILDSKGLILYRLARYPDALDTYNAALKQNPQQAASLYMRGQTKRKLGDAAGGAADIAAAKALNADTKKIFEGTDIAD
jgi:predicted aspartyl protease